jgi:outer membrane protein, multidrug efflux system
MDHNVQSSFGRTSAGLAAACALTVAALAGSGCASSRGPLAKPTVSVPSPPAWSQAAGATTAGDDLARWWERLQDPTLNALVDRALQNNRDLKTARSRLRQARAQVQLTHANRLPSASASGSGSFNDSTKSDASGSASGGIDASWELDVFGALKDAEVAARADLARTGENLRNTQVSLVAEVANDYVSLRGDQRRLAIAQQSLQAQSETLQITEWRAQAGLVSTLDVEQARTTVSQTRAALPSLEASIAQTEHALAVLLGTEPSALVTELERDAPLPSLPATINAGIPAETLRQRPDVRAAERTIVAETARLSQADKARYPSFRLNGSLTVQAMTGALTGGTSLVSSLVGSLSQTLFDGGRIRQQIEIQSAVQEQAVISYEATVLSALREVEDALVSLQKNGERLVSLRAAAESARNAARLARTRYNAGLVDFQTVLDTQRTVLSAEESEAVTQASQVTSLIQLYKALGGGWTNGDGVGTVTSQAGNKS